MTFDIKATAEKLNEVRNSIDKVEATLKELKYQEEELKKSIELFFLQSNINSFSLGSGDLIYKSKNVHFQISDYKKFTKVMLKGIVDRYRSGKDISEGFLLQKRVHDGMLKEIFEETFSVEVENATSETIRKIKRENFETEVQYETEVKMRKEHVRDLIYQKKASDIGLNYVIKNNISYRKGKKS